MLLRGAAPGCPASPMTRHPHTTHCHSAPKGLTFHCRKKTVVAEQCRRECGPAASICWWQSRRCLSNRRGQKGGAQGPYPASSADGEPEAQVAIVGPGLGARVRTASGPGGFERLLGLAHPSSTDFGSRTP